MIQLVNIQKKLKAPKSQYNLFGKYKYRSCEDILEAVKPLLAEEKCTLVISDEIVPVGGRIYVKATATLTNESGEAVQTSAFAREEEAKKGMDSSQVTGAASSYARKYALNGLFCIDDTKDSDADGKGDSEAGNELETALAEVREAKSLNELTAIFGRWKVYQHESRFMSALSARKKEVTA